VSWNGKNLFNQSVKFSYNWSKATFAVKATKTSTVLQFKFRNDSWYFGLDDVSVVPISAPSLRPAMNPNGTFKFTWNAVPEVPYQIQYKTNLLQADWINLGNPVNARAATMSVTNEASADPQRYYRVIVPIPE
jgi:hypothetical protein